MSVIKNKVTSQFADIASYDATTGTVTGITLSDTVTTNNLVVNADSSFGNATSPTTNTFNIYATGNAVQPFTGAVVINGNPVGPNILLSTAIGNGWINTGNGISIGGANPNYGTGPLRVTSRNYNGYWMQAYDVNNYPSHQFSSSPTTIVSNVVQNDSTFSLYQSNVGNILQANPSNVTIPLSNLVVANGNIGVSTGYLAVTKGQTALNSQVDEYIKVGGNTNPNVTVIGINTANSVYSGIRLSKAGTERWFIGTDASGTTGNLIVNGPGGSSYLTLRNTDSTTANSIITAPMSTRKWEGRQTAISQSGGTNFLILFDITDTNTIPLFSHSSANGVFTNTGPTRKFTFNLQVGFNASSTGFTECDIWLQQNATSPSGTARRGQTNYVGVAKTAQILSTSWTFVMATNDTVSPFAWASTNYWIGNSQFGTNTNYSAVISVVEVL